MQQVNQLSPILACHKGADSSPVALLLFQLSDNVPGKANDGLSTQGSAPMWNMDQVPGSLREPVDGRSLSKSFSNMHINKSLKTILLQISCLVRNDTKILI